MYDFLIDTAHTLVKNGLTLSSAGAIVFLLLKQRRLKKRLRKFIPWLLQEDNEVKEYVTNQQIIMENQRRMMRKMEIEPCDSLPNISNPAKILHTGNYFSYSRKDIAPASRLKRRMKRMLKKIGSRKFWALVAACVTSCLVLFGVSEDVTLKVVALIGHIGAIMTYLLVEGSIDKARAKGDNTDESTQHFTGGGPAV
ncbi:hypothetical protein [Paenibacillus sp. HJGM_3]|uniref:hypothetical protein n=1 Tax=Paenibacillus sp. HJGM_3 TaxID=3379816 RepID=UPI00385E9D37